MPDKLDFRYEDDPNLDAAIEMGDDDIVIEEMVEHEDFLIVLDPTQEDTENGDDWAVILLKDPYSNWLVKFFNMEQRGGEIIFDYTLLSFGTDSDRIEFDEVELTNRLTNVLLGVIKVLHEEGATIYTDEEGNEVEL
jgi:hypothetical protein